MESLALALAALTGLAGAIPTIQTHVDTSESDWRSKITNVVVLVEENRSFDTFAGGLSYNSSIDGLLHHNYCNALNASNPNGMQPWPSYSHPRHVSEISDYTLLRSDESSYAHSLTFDIE